MAHDPAARRWYIDYMDLHDELFASHFGGVQDAAAWRNGRGRVGKRNVRESLKSRSPGGAPSTGLVRAAAPPSFILHPSAFLDSPLLSYLVAVLVFAAGIAGAWVWRLPDAGEGKTGAVGQVANLPGRDQPNSRELTVRGPIGISPNVAFTPPIGTDVGRITAAVDCRWANAGTAAADGAAVILGREYALDSGILEIRYHAGPDVIVQGPAVYEVDSDRGGRLLRGKLTVRVEPRWDRNEDFASLVQLNFGTGQGGEGRWPPISNPG